MRLTVLFWNLNGKPLYQQVGRLARRYEANVIALAEASQDEGLHIAALEAETGRPFAEAWSECNRLRLFVCFPAACIRAVEDNTHYSIQALSLSGAPEILLTVAHLPSKLYAGRTDGLVQCQNLIAAVRRAEEGEGHRRTVVAGDLNLDPFDPGVVDASGLNATMSAEVARREQRIVGGQEYPFLYNPMWGRLGDRTPGPPRTYYRSGSNYCEYFWHMLDQVLVRPELLGSFGHGDLSVPVHDGEVPLLTEQGHPGGAWGSDHLPLVFALSFDDE